jgi:hypothetical protein
MSAGGKRDTDKFLRSALSYARLEFAVFPCYGILSIEREGALVPICSCGNSGCESPGKHPTTKRGFKDATVDPTQITQWWNAHPEWNVAIACEPSGLVVVDVDPRHGGDATWAQLKADLGITDDTAQAISGSGGPHV